MNIDGLISKLVGRDWVDSDIVLLLGAGCSRTSGIPGVSDLARRWLIEARRDDPDILPGITEENAGDHYYEICSKRWGNRQEIKSEIGRLSSSATPGVGYVMLAKLIASRAGHGNIRTILTTNFDNLVEQAFLLFTTERPIVIPDPKLIDSFGKPRNAVQIVKLHGDSRYAPKNTEEETRIIDRDVTKQIEQQISRGILLVLGYGGNDVGLGEAIAKWLKGGTFQQVIWVDKSPPGPAVSRPAKVFGVEGRIRHICHYDFDDFVLRFGEKLHRYHASSASTDMHIYRYHDQMMWRFGMYGNTGRAPAISAPENFGDYFRFLAEAAMDVKDNKLDSAKSTLMKGLSQNSGSTNYKVLLASVYKSIFKNLPMCGTLCKEAVAAAPDHAAANSVLAIFYKEDRNRELATKHFMEAKKLYPSDWNNRLNYCGYLLSSPSAKERAEGEFEFYECDMHVYEPRHRLELAFYAYAHGLSHTSPLRDIRNYLKTDRSPDYDLSDNIARASVVGHQNPALLGEIARVMSDGHADAAPVLAELTKLIEAGAL